jgi:hypothetical protein
VNALLGDLRTVPYQNMFDGKEVERDTRAKNIAIDYMIHNPGRVFGLLPRKLLVLFEGDTEGLYFSMGMMPGSKSYAAPLGTLPRALWLPPSGLEGRTEILYKNLLRLSQLYYVLIIALFAISLPIVLKLPIRPQHIGLAIIVSLTLTYLVLYGDPRYHFSMMPWVAIYSGLGAQTLLLGKSSLRIAGTGQPNSLSVCNLKSQKFEAENVARASLP